MNIRAFLNTVTNKNFTLPIVILYVTTGCNLRCVMCSYRDPLPGELTLAELKDLAGDLSELGLRQIVYSGGEPLMRRDFPSICKIFQSLDVRQSLLTNGVLLEKKYAELQPYISEVIISVDGPNPETHNAIRGVDTFEKIIHGVESVVASRPKPVISIRTVVQRRNFRKMNGMVELAKSLGVDRISFLAADVSSDAFHRDHSGASGNNDDIILTPEETREFKRLTDEFIHVYRDDIERHFISETPAKLKHIVRYYEALAGMAPFPRNVCNAPNVSTVITSTGELLPCYFLPAFGNVRSNVLKELLNSSEIRETRQCVKQYTLQRCHECVCTLHVNPLKALADRF